MAGMPRASNLRHVDKQGHCANKYDAALRRPLVRMPHVLSSRLGLFGEKARQPAAHRVGFFRGPFAKTLAGFHAELAGLDLVAQERVRPRGAVKVVIEHLRDVELKVEADQVRLLHGPEHRGARAEPFAHDRVDRLGIADVSSHAKVGCRQIPECRGGHAPELFRPDAAGAWFAPPLRYRSFRSESLQPAAPDAADSRNACKSCVRDFSDADRSRRRELPNCCWRGWSTARLTFRSRRRFPV